MGKTGVLEAGVSKNQVPRLAGRSADFPPRSGQPEVEEASLDEWEALMGKSLAQTPSEPQEEQVLTDWEGLKHL